MIRSSVINGDYIGVGQAVSNVYLGHNKISANNQGLEGVFYSYGDKRTKRQYQLRYMQCKHQSSTSRSIAYCFEPIDFYVMAHPGGKIWDSDVRVFCFLS
jgi:hypothetical protein